MGRLSNPSEATKALIFQATNIVDKRKIDVLRATTRSIDHELDSSNEEEGRLSNPVQRRLANAKIHDLVEDYVRGMSVNALAHKFGIHRTTVMIHLESREVHRRRSVRKLSTASVVLAAGRYENGLSLRSVAKEFGVNEATITREFRAAGIAIRPRRGWSATNLNIRPLP